MSAGRITASGLVGTAVALLFAADPARPAGVEVEDLRPGLVAVYRDAARPPREVMQLEPTIAVSLNAGEAPHPRLAANGGTARWEGYLKIVRPGLYRFTAIVRGRFRLSIGGKEVLAGEVKEAAPATVKGPQTRLEAGVQPLVAEFTRLPGTARLDLFWEAPHFHREPLHHEALGHLPALLPAQLVADRDADRGRFLVEEHSCMGCHPPAVSDRRPRVIVLRWGPDLSQVGRRLHAGWIYVWLASPQKVRPSAVMPQLFRDDDAGRTERYAVAHYLASLDGPARQTERLRNPREYLESVQRGRRLFTSIGCVVCHEAKDATPGRERLSAAPSSFIAPPSSFPLGALGSAWPVQPLAAYLQNPLAVDPSGRMPHMLLQQREAEDLARFLCQTRDAMISRELPPAPDRKTMLAAFKRVEPRVEELASFERLPAVAQWNELGRRIVIDKRCNTCHTIAPGGKPFASVLAGSSFEDLNKPARQSAGCLADRPEAGGEAPRFALTGADRHAIRAFLRQESNSADSPAPAFAARMTLLRFNCLACHTRDGEGGLSAERIEELRRYEKADNAEAITPPTLTGTGHKLRTPWMKQVLTQAARARPWMGLRMPQFGDANVGRLPEGLAALEGTVPDETLHPSALSAAKIEAGRQLVGKGFFGCISCHDLAGIPNTGTRGPDLAGMSQRVRYEWYRRWLEQPLRYQAGTRMPTIFPDGKSLVTSILGGDADAQADAMWAYLGLGSNLPLPDGMQPPRGLVLMVKNRPIVLRTFLPDVGTHSVAIGLPGSVAAAFDCSTCRLAYAWSGNFLDAAPTWDGRGGNQARPLGPRFWTAPAGCPWGVNASNEPPDFVAQAHDPAYGAPLPEGQYYTGARQLHFDGYEIDRAGLPTFRYRVGPGDEPPLEVTEQPRPLHSTVGSGIARHITLKTPAGRTAWLLAGEGQQPRILNAKGAPVAVDLTSGSVDLPAAGGAIVLPQGGQRAVVLMLGEGVDGTQWRLQRQGTAWKAILRLPAAVKRVDLAIWAPYRDEPALLKDLVTTK
jgi:mono/diheme cytochrome c family protein